MSVKKYVNGAWQDVESLKRYSDNAWQDCEFARKHVNGAWEDVWDGNRIYVLKDGIWQDSVKSYLYNSDNSYVTMPSPSNGELRINGTGSYLDDIYKVRITHPITYDEIMGKNVVLEYTGYETTGTIRWYIYYRDFNENYSAKTECNAYGPVTSAMLVNCLSAWASNTLNIEIILNSKDIGLKNIYIK